MPITSSATGKAGAMAARHTFAFLVLAASALPLGARAEEVDLKAAEAQFKKSCGTCHTIEPGAPLRQGPNLRGVVGRTAGTLAEFPKYSPALKAAGAGGLAWTPEKLDAWLANPAALVPGVLMPYRQADADKRKLVIEYLKSLPSP